jgi:alpha-1,6-mannosyltransferase
MADETFGLSVLEAQASGLPVVGFASGAMVQRVPQHLGLLVALDHTQAMAQAVMQIWRGDCAAMGLRARAHVTSGFSWQQTFETLLDEIYPRALARSAARSAPFVSYHRESGGSQRWLPRASTKDIPPRGSSGAH